MQKGGALKIFDPCKGGPEKNYLRFSITIEFTCFSMGLTHNFHGKNGGPDIFLHQVPPLQVFVNGPLEVYDWSQSCM